MKHSQSENTSPQGSVRWSVVACRVLVAASLALAGTLKLLTLLDEPSLRGAHSLASPLREPLVAGGLGVLEVIVSIGLATSMWRVAGVTAFWLTAAFGVGFAVIVAMGMPTGWCGCFGTWEAPIGAHFAMILGMMLGARVIVCAD